MIGNFEKCLAFVLQWEGGFVDHPADPGGATNRGITLKTLRAYMPGATVDDLRHLDDATIARIYRDGYWMAVHGDELPDGLDLCIFDAAVHSGPGRAIRWLQRALGVTVDGVIGQETLYAAASCDVPQTIRTICDMRLEFLAGLMAWRAFGRGWARRVEAVEKAALEMAEAASAPKPAERPGKSVAGPVAAVGAAAGAAYYIGGVAALITALVVIVALVAALRKRDE